MSSSLQTTVRTYFFESLQYLLKTHSLGEGERLASLRCVCSPVKIFVLTCERVGNDITFYAKARRYYEGMTPTEESMLGGYTEIAGIDIDASRRFLARFVGDSAGQARSELALDCGAGIGRITKHLLLPEFRSVDMVDMTRRFLNIARKSYLCRDEARRVNRFICSRLQDFRPPSASYDVIWIQWVIGYLTDEDLVELLVRCRRALRQDGVIIVKDNVAREGVVLDEVDGSVARELRVLHGIVRRAALRVLAEQEQRDFPSDIMPVWMFALQ
ncbi:N-terminal Xaa-Pro-Lys N-methyltransferase 1-like isoform X1 [Lethenteron reissneri]|uniref:N-terminal Xaa-Pro-Lys N-methyltransferase 1-like isoform X1 n=3 Tax=Lethenteron reissneri TaxID=7753 RepID=UPI002AB76BCC|nr:N-terminal Xaa-Pro-Lys N-methyltransferase 1-like isoform X1 [Lethenteron reissneri]XP_061406207.1 N-terminal Xaa-Pro-Lys N-methyltransferase 1-like isoform X1 [Lethenteron reissneri]